MSGKQTMNDFIRGEIGRAQENSPDALTPEQEKLLPNCVGMGADYDKVHENLLRQSRPLASVHGGEGTGAIPPARESMNEQMNRLILQSVGRI